MAQANVTAISASNHLFICLKFSDVHPFDATEDLATYCMVRGADVTRGRGVDGIRNLSVGPADIGSSPCNASVDTSGFKRFLPRLRRDLGIRRHIDS